MTRKRGKNENDNYNRHFLVLCRRPIDGSYFELPCIQSFSTTKQSHDNTPLSYSPIHSKLEEGISLCWAWISTVTCQTRE